MSRFALSGHLGGIARSNRDMVTNLNKYGWKTTVISSSLNQKDDHIINKSVHTIRIPGYIIYKLRNTRINAYLRWWNDRLYSRKVGRILNEIESKNGSFDIIEFTDIHCEGYYYLKHRKNQDSKVVIRAFNPSEIVKLSINNPENAYCNMHFIDERFVYEKSSLITSPSQWTKQFLINKYGINEKKISVIPHPINTELFKNRGAKISERKPIILFVGRLDRNKGVFDLIRAFYKVLKKHCEAELHLIGPNALHEYDLKEFISLLVNCPVPGKIKILGVLNDKQLSDAYSNAMVLASISLIPESPSLVILEALATNLPVVTYNIGALPESTQFLKYAEITPIGNIELLSDKLIKVLDLVIAGDYDSFNSRDEYIVDYCSPDLVLSKFINNYISLINNE